MLDVIIIGNSPAVSVCAIYLKTANHTALIIQPTMNCIEYNCEGVPGVELINNENENSIKNKASLFTQLCLKQSENLGIKIVLENNLQIFQKNGNFLIKNDEIEHESKFLVTDLPIKDVATIKNDKYYLLKDYVEFSEGIVLAGGGCKVAFKINERI